MFWVDLLGYAASASVLATFCMSAMAPLRAVAICSNVLFAAYGGLAHIYPVLILHMILLPLNVMRLLQVIVDTRNGYAALLTRHPGCRQSCLRDHPIGQIVAPRCFARMGGGVPFNATPAADRPHGTSQNIEPVSALVSFS